MNSQPESSAKKLLPIQPPAVPADQELSETDLDAVAGGKTDRMEGKFGPESGTPSGLNEASAPFRGKTDRLP